MKKKIVFLVIILAVAAGGFFYWLWTWQPEIEPDFSIGEPSEAPTLFSKGDYKIEERADGKFIVVEKVGLTCKVPEGWKIEIEGSDIPEPEYWVNLYSPDITTTTSNLLTSGCKITILAGFEEKNNEEVGNNIEFIKENPGKSHEIKQNYQFRIIEINDNQGLAWTSPEFPTLGQSFGIEIPLGKKKLISMDILSPPGYKEKCFSIWEEFLKNIVIE